MKVAIFYHIAEREVQNAYLLKAELNRRGHEVYIYYFNNIYETKEVLNYTPDVVITHGLRNSLAVKKFTGMFNQKIDRIVNLQYEQVLSKVWHDSCHHIPSGLAKNAIHLCWGEENKEVLINNGISKENAIVVGSLSVDLSRNEFKSIYKNKEEMSKIYNLSPLKPWILFISNFTLSNLSKKSRDGFGMKLGQYNVDQIHNIGKNQQEEIIKWIDKYLQDNDCEFIYRIHAGENLIVSLNELNNKYTNFHLINEDSVKSWINVCDRINTWMSTSIVECYFMDKCCSILRPFDIPKNIDSEIMTDARYIKSYEDFCKYNLTNNTSYNFPIDKEVLFKYYDFDINKFAYEKICDLLEKIVNNNLIMNLYK